MAWEVVKWVMEDRSIGGNDKFVALVLANYAHKDGTGARPSVGTQSDVTGLSRKTVGQRLAHLVEIGYIEITRASNQHSPAVYSFTFQMGSTYSGDPIQPGNSVAQPGRSGRPAAKNLRTNQGRNLFEEPNDNDVLDLDLVRRQNAELRAKIQGGAP